jgi:hypothetical protein
MNQLCPVKLIHRKTAYRNGEVIVIQLDKNLNSRLLVKTIAQRSILYFAPFLIENSVPLPAILMDFYNPIPVGDKTDFEYFERFIKTHYPEVNIKLWERICREWELQQKKHIGNR